MESLPLDLAGLLAIAAGLGWAAGIRLYATLFVIGLAGWLQWVTQIGRASCRERV